MNNAIKANIKSQDQTTFTRSVWQYDYGQILQITGAELPPAVEVQFSLYEKSGETITRVATTTDGVTEVQIPNELLKREGCKGDYFIYAYIFVSDEKSGNTKYKIAIAVKKRPKRKSQPKNLFRSRIYFTKLLKLLMHQLIGRSRQSKTLRQVQQKLGNMLLVHRRVRLQQKRPRKMRLKKSERKSEKQSKLSRSRKRPL